jgi:hypothetical protein
MGRKTAILTAFGIGLAMILLSPLLRAAPAANEFESTCEEAAIYGFPLIQGYGVIYENFIDKDNPHYKCPLNQIYHTATAVTPNDKGGTPNVDVLLSMFCADLRAEPVVLTLPEIEGQRYYSGQLFDLYSFNYGNVGTRTTGNRRGTYMIAGPSWKGEDPKGIDKVFRSETTLTFGAFRTQLFNPADLNNVKKIQSGYRLETLSSFLGKPAPAAPAEIKWPKFELTKVRTNPFSYLNFVLQFCPAVGPAETEKPLRAKFAGIGIDAGKPYSLDRLTVDEVEFMQQGVKHALEKIKSVMTGAGKIENGWRVVTEGFGSREDYQDNWKLRGAAAMVGIYGESAKEVLSPFLTADSDGKKPDCHDQRYTLTFQKEQLPPVNAFWSLTMYDGNSKQLVDNPLKRYLMNSRMLPDLKKNDDGSLTIYIQKNSPGKEKESNWLPAQDGPIYLVMRLYWPKKEALDGEWKPPVLKRVDK